MISVAHMSLESWARKFGGTAVLGFLCTLLIVGKCVHHAFLLRGRFCGWLLLPPAVISGCLGLIWFSIISGTDPAIMTNLTAGLRGLNSNMTNFVFAALILGLNCSRTTSQHFTVRGILTSIFHEGMPMVIYSQVLIWGQSACCLLSLFIANSLFGDVHPLFAAMVPLGIEAGEDVVVAPVFESEWSKLVTREAESIGLLTSCILGIVLISCEPFLTSHGWIGKTKGYSRDSSEFSSKHTGHAEAFERTQLKIKRSFSAGNRLNELSFRAVSGSDERSMNQSPTPPPPPHNSPGSPRSRYSGDKNDKDKSATASLGAHISLIALTVFISFGVGLFARLGEIELNFNFHVLSGIQLFKLSMCCAYVSMHIMNRRTTSFRFNRDWFMRLCGLMLDLLTISRLSVAGPGVDSIGKTHYAICGGFVAVCVLWHAICFVFLAKHLFPNYWFKRAIILSADGMGHAQTGLLFARTLDPAMESPVPAAFAYKLMLFVIPSSGAKNTFVAASVQNQGPLPALVISAAVVALWLIIFLRYFRHRFVPSTEVGSSERSRHEGSEDAEPSQPLLHSVASVEDHGECNRGASRSPSFLDTGDQSEAIGLELSQMDPKSIGFQPSSSRQALTLEFADSSDSVTLDLSATASSGDNTPNRRPTLSVNKANDPSRSPQRVSSPAVGLQLSEPSSIASNDQLLSLAKWLPPGKAFRRWVLRYSLRRDGACMDTLVSQCTRNVSHAAACGGDCGFIIIEDSWGYIFGGFVAHPLEIKSTYYGTGEDFVFSLAPHRKIFRWTGANNFFITSSSASFSMGGGGGGFAFHLDDELDTGVSNRSATFDNDQLSSSEFFKCLNVEYWCVDAFDTSLV